MASLQHKPVSVGISGFAAYLPPYRVDLRRWCEWTGASWDKVRTVVGTGFRMPGADQSVYTMAATAALRLLDQYDVDPQRVRYLALGTESSTDNSAGAVIVRGMLDAALRERGLAPLNRHCEVPEFKHACLGGVYAMKSALRFLATEPGDAAAIVVSADVAKYDLGSSGEPTQGAGAVAMLIEKSPRLLAVDLGACGSASAYRAVDFRKPMMRINGNGTYFRETPVFNGKYSTTCYLDEALQALRDMLSRMKRDPREYFRSVRAVFMHRPYERMPLNALCFSYLSGLAKNDGAGRTELTGYCEAAGLRVDDVVDELRSTPDILGFALEGELERDPWPLTMRLLREFRAQPVYRDVVAAKLELGALPMRELGNLYSASLFAWMAAGLEEAAGKQLDLANQEVLALGYGSGDAAEAIPMRTVPHWTDAAARIGFAGALQPSVNLTREEYEGLHRTGRGPVPVAGREEFVIERVGSSTAPEYADEGIEFYRYVR
ncbi:MAG: hydroxymethylglutaryl-CoA synthase [Gammaproteobacteria bacterium]|nr:MAG: hydroxymethylglutaryl-CoA synthase [Gammaproteobacteria bacterium]